MRGRQWMVLCTALCLALTWTGCADASNGLLPGDPMVKITAPPALAVDVDSVLMTLSEDVSHESGLDRKLLTYYWQRFEAINCMGEKRVDSPLYVDLYVPDFMEDDLVGVIMHAIADSLARTTGVDKQWIFIHTHTPQKGRVLLSGDIQ